MEINEFINPIRSVSDNFNWIKRISVEKEKARVRIRLLMNHDFVDVFYNAKKETISYSYVESAKRIFGANNMKIGWHWHPYDNIRNHVWDEPVTIETFLKTLEKELRKRDKIG
jgi:hypothetical protein